MNTFLDDRHKDEESSEIVYKLDKDLLEDMIYEFKNEDFYFDQQSTVTMSQVNLSSRSLVKKLIHIEELTSLICNVEYRSGEFLLCEYIPSREAMNMIKYLRKASLNAQNALTPLLKNKKRIQKLNGSMDVEVFEIIAAFKLGVCKAFKEIFDAYDIQVYPEFRKKVQDTLAFYQEQISQK